MKDPKHPIEFTDMSDYPQDGYGNLDVDKEFPKTKVVRMYDDEEELDEIENDNDDYFE